MPNIQKLSNILDKKLHNNDKHLINYIFNFLKCKCDVCNEIFFENDTFKVICYDPHCPDIDKNKYYCFKCCSDQCPDMCYKCSSFC